MVGRKKRNRSDSGQTMVEFALTLPVVLMLVFGIIEFGFLLWSYSSVNSAAREAARYGIAIGVGNVSGQRYYDCEGIKDAGMRAGSFAGMEEADISIQYDNGPTNATGYTVKYNSCEDLAALSGNDLIEFGDRIVVSVTHDYQPIAAMMGFNITPFSMESRSNRTIVKAAEVVASGNASGSGSGSGGSGSAPACFTVSTTHVGDGSDPTVSPASSVGCNLSEYLAGETLTLTALPASGWVVSGWSGTDNDAATASNNTVSMPGGNLAVSVTYTNGSPTCYALSLSSTGSGSGSGPTASPANSTGCASGTYVSGESITLTAAADSGSGISGWSGTTNNASTSGVNTVSMPASNHTASVTFDVSASVCYSLSLSHSGNGTNPSPSAQNCTGGYTAGTVVYLNATANTGYEISGWSGTNNDSSFSNINSVVMTSNKAVSVTYVLTSVYAPPVNVLIPTDPSDWKWQNGQQQCQRIDLSWSANPSWPSSPISYEVFHDSTSWGNVFSTSWNADFTTNMGEQITLGVRAVFTGGSTSQIQEVTYICFKNDLQFWGSVVK